MGKTGFAKNISRLLHSLRFRLSLWYGSILVVVVVLFGSIIYSVEAASLTGTIDGELRFVGEQLPLTLIDQPGRFELQPQFSAILQTLAGREIPTENLNGLANLPAIRSLLEGRYVLLLVDGQGKITQHFGLISEADVARLAAMASSSDGQIRDFTSNPSPGQNSADYRIYFNRTTKSGGTVILGLQWEGAGTLRDLVLTLFLAGGFILLLAAGGGFWLAGRAMKPVQAITRTAREIGETDLSRRLNLKSQDELGELAATFDLMLSRLEAAFERQRQFTADASHELRTPLTIMNLEVNRVLARPHSAEEMQQSLQVIQTETDYMSQLVNDLLVLARADTGPVALNREKLDLSDLALDVVERFAPLARQQNLILQTLNLPEVEIEGDRLYLTRMLANLVENALKYTAGSGNLVQVETGCSEQRAWVRVSDNGPGIAPEHLPHLFERFYQADLSRSDGTKVRGSGLGLAIVRWVAQAHGGTVEVNSQPGEGTSFVVWLPA